MITNDCTGVVIVLSDTRSCNKISPSFNPRETGCKKPISLHQCCWAVNQFAMRSKNFKYLSNAFKTLKDLTIRRLIGYRYGNQNCNGMLSYIQTWYPEYLSDIFLTFNSCDIISSYIFYAKTGSINHQRDIFHSDFCVNSSTPSAAYMRQWIGSALVQIMTCRLFGAKPLSTPMLVNFQLDP